MANPPQRQQKPQQQRARRIVRHKVKQWRTFRKLTQDELGEKIGKTRGLISQLEIGETDLTEDTIYALAGALKITPGDLLHNDPESETILTEVTRHLSQADREIQTEVLGYVRGKTERR